jgi:formylmethanofuran dehydrogenase subunit E
MKSLCWLSKKKLNLMGKQFITKAHYPSNEETIKCSRCEEPTPESEAMEVGAWWVCGICYDDL